MAAYSSLLEQEVLVVPEFTLECGRTLRDAPVAYKTWGRLNAAGNNVMVICHAFTGSADVEDWWGPLIGNGRAFDPARFFIVCANALGSPYGSASPIVVNPDTSRLYGVDFPRTSIRDDVRIHKLVLDHLGVSSVAVVIGGSMGGMAVLEWPLCMPPGYVRRIVPIATSAQHSAWCISWGEAQRQSIFSDPDYAGGRYTTQPKGGLAAARMTALLTYRSRDSFVDRFGRNAQPRQQLTPPGSPKPEDANRAERGSSGRRSEEMEHEPLFSAQSYLRYQGNKFTARFDANCYVHITRKMDTHDIARGRSASVHAVLAQLPSRALVIGIASDGLFTTTEQREIAEHIPGAQLIIVPSLDGHDGFLLEFRAINEHVLQWLRRELPEFYTAEERQAAIKYDSTVSFAVKKTSVFGEAEVDVTRW